MKQKRLKSILVLLPFIIYTLTVLFMFAMPPQPLSDGSVRDLDNGHYGFIFAQLPDVFVFVGGIVMSAILWKIYIKP